MQQMFAIGGFFDAKQQMETQRLFQIMEFEAHKDYHPSEGFCLFGTNVRSLAHSESKANLNAAALDQLSIRRQLGQLGTAGSVSGDADIATRWQRFKTTYCDPRENNWRGGDTGMAEFCKGGAEDATRTNHDINYTRLIEEARTLDIDFTDKAGSASGDEEDIIALSNNLFAHQIPKRNLSTSALADTKKQEAYLDLRSVIAKRSVATHSFNTIVGLKSSGTTAEGGNTNYIYAVMQELGMEQEEIRELLGENPSYFAQLEILSKRVFQNPDFYANLYDKPANIKRKSVALKAVEMMLDRAIYESQLRQEMVSSVLLSTRVEKGFKRADQELGSVE